MSIKMSSPGIQYTLDNGATMTLSRVYSDYEYFYIDGNSGEQSGAGYHVTFSNDDGSNYWIACFDHNGDYLNGSTSGYLSERGQEAISSGAYFYIFYGDNVWYEWESYYESNGLNEEDLIQHYQDLDIQFLGKISIDNDDNWTFTNPNDYTDVETIGDANSEGGDVTIGTVRYKLPIGYTQLGYITVPSGAYLNTGYTPNNNTKIYMSMALNTVSGNQCWFCARGSSTDTNTFTLFNINNTLRFDYYNTIGTASTTNAVSTTYKMIANGNYCYISNYSGTTLVQKHEISTSFTAGSNLILFESWTAGSGLGNPMNSAKCYEVKIWEGTVMKRWLIPCKNPSNVVGMYDQVNDTFYSSANNNTAFTAGNVIEDEALKGSVVDVVKYGSTTVYTKLNALKYGWNTSKVNGLVVTRTSSPYAGASTGTASNISSQPASSTPYFGDVFSVIPTHKITVTKNTGVSSVSLTYRNISNTETTASNANGDYWGRAGTEYSWSATAATGYNLSSASGSGNVPAVAAYDESTFTVLTDQYQYYSGASVTSIAPTASVKSFTLTISTVNPSYIASYSVSRTSSPLKGAATGALSSGATIYHDDYLYLSASAKSSVITYTPSSLSTPTLTSSFTSGASTSSLVITNPNSTGCTIYYKLSSASSYSSTTVGSSSSKTITGLTPEATYNVYLSAFQTKNTTSYSVSPASSNITVSGDTTATFTGSSSTSQEITTTAVNSSTASLKLDGVLAPTCSISRTNGNSYTYTLHAKHTGSRTDDTYTPNGTITSAVITGKRSNTSETTFIDYSVTTTIIRGNYTLQKTGASVTLSSSEIASLNAETGAITLRLQSPAGSKKTYYYHTYMDLGYKKSATVSYSATNASSYSVTMTLRFYVGSTLTATKTGTVASGGTLSGDTYSTTTAGSGYCNAYATYSSKNSSTTTSSTVTWTVV